MHQFLRNRGSWWVTTSLATVVLVVVIAATFHWRQASPRQPPLFNDVWSGLGQPNRTRSPAEPAPAMAAKAPSLEELLPGLESRVAANPSDIGSQILLAQTYGELGRTAEGLTLLEKLARAHPTNAELSLARAELLGQTGDKRQLRSAFDLYGRAAQLSPALGSLARLRQGEIRLQLNDRAGAIRLWQQQIDREPDSPERAQLEAAIAAARRSGG